MKLSRSPEFLYLCFLLRWQTIFLWLGTVPIFDFNDMFIHAYCYDCIQSVLRVYRRILSLVFILLNLRNNTY